MNQATTILTRTGSAGLDAVALEISVEVVTLER